MKPEFDTSQCKGCHYWRDMVGMRVNACHFRIDHKTGALKVDGVCISWKKKEPYKTKKPKIGKAKLSGIGGYIAQNKRRYKR